MTFFYFWKHNYDIMWKVVWEDAIVDILQNKLKHGRSSHLQVPVMNTLENSTLFREKWGIQGYMLFCLFCLKNRGIRTTSLMQF